MEPLTRAEKTEYRETSLHRHVLEFIQSLRAKTDAVSVHSMGQSGEGQDMPVLVLGATSPEDARRRGKPVILVIANIHAGEVEGKEALLMLARDMTLGSLRRFPERLCLVFVPNYNPDGNDRISPENRKLDLAKFEGQINPEGGVGTRYTGQGINLNRDYMKLEAVESRRLTALYNRWWPHLTIDCHTTDGSIHAYHLTYDSANNFASGAPEPVDFVRQVLLPTVSESLERRTGHRTFFYGNFRDPNDPTHGWETYSPLPRYGSNCRGLTGRMDILLEAYSYIPFRDRVSVTYEILSEIFEFVGSHAPEIVRIGDSAVPRESVGIRYSSSAEVAGEAVIRSYDLDALRARRLEGALASYRCPWFAKFAPATSIDRPTSYLVPREEAGAIRKLEEHGIVLERCASESRFKGEVYRIVSLEHTSSPDVGTEKRFETVVQVTKDRRACQAREGDVWVKTDQRLGTVAVYLLEPESDDGLVRWGYLDGSLAAGRDYPVVRLPSERV